MKNFNITFKSTVKFGDLKVLLDTITTISGRAVPFRLIVIDDIPSSFVVFHFNTYL